MNRLALFSAIGMLVFARPLRTEPRELATLDSVRRGMSQAEVRALAGPPVRTSRQILFRRHLEQWHFQEPSGWVEFNCPRGEEAVVTQKSSPFKSP
jgi:hypothetical protein